MKTLSCLKNFGSFTCLLVSSGVSIWTWYYVTSPKTVGEIYERDGRVLRTMDEILSISIKNYEEPGVINVKKSWFYPYCSLLSFQRLDQDLGRWKGFYEKVCIRD